VPEQERAQHQVAEARLMGHDGAHLRNRNRQDPPGSSGHRSQVDALPGEHADLTRELEPAVTGDERRAGLAVALDDSAVPSSITIRS
jgi:hypothetical protein